MRTTHFPVVITTLLIAGLFLTACGSEPAGAASASVAPQIEDQPVIVAESEVASEEDPVQESIQRYWVEEVPRADEQGAVEIVITPLNLNAPWQTVDFRVAMNTHSVDLSMDLETLATLETDTGHVVKATLWDAPRGGHHVQGILSFPASLEGKSIMDNVTRLTLTIRDVDAAERVFAWER